MKKYHNELKRLSIVIMDNAGYYCGLCDECEEVYREFIKVLNIVRKKFKDKESEK